MTATVTIDTAPTIILRGEVRVSKAKNKLGRKLSKLANATPTVIRSPLEQVEHCRKASALIPTLVAERAKLGRTEKHVNDRRRSEAITLELRELCMPVYGITLDDGEDGYTVFASANVLSDYQRESIAFVVIAMPVLQRFGRIASIRKSDVDQAYLEQFAASRANDHAMGKAQNAFRLAKLEGDSEAMTVAYYWLWHGSLKVCKDPCCKCSTCNADRTQARSTTSVIQAGLLESLAEAYIETESRSYFNGSRLPHRMKALPLSDGVSEYGRETYDEMRIRLGMA
tara:strand:- start:39041 stop:39892 length:852 start_codon:yes stop_codon:yes gene_type:complete